MRTSNILTFIGGALAGAAIALLLAPMSGEETRRRISEEAAKLRDRCKCGNPNCKCGSDCDCGEEMTQHEE